MNVFISLLVLICVNDVFCSQCETQYTCGECITFTSERCMWCSQEKDEKFTRCRPQSYDNTKTNNNWCDNDKISRPYSKIVYNVTEPFSSNVQLQPKNLVIKANPGEEVKFDIHYKPAASFPLDVYFLMDYTLTMKTHKDALEQQATNIYKELKNLKSKPDVLLGVGSFGEKPGLPFAERKAASQKYADPYSFKNHLSLTSDMNAFKKALKESKFTTNFDDPEAALDALMQVMLCEKELNWRNKTRKIIVLATDNTYHSAGDGKLIGAFDRFDMKCHMKDNMYSQEDSLKYDYPTVKAVNHVAKNGGFVIIFAGASNTQREYEGLSKEITGSSYQVLKSKSNIFNIIKEAYESSIKDIKLNVGADSSFDINIDQQCKNNLNKTIKNCESTPNNPTVTIPVTIKSIKCNPLETSKVQKNVITIYPENGLSEKIKINFEVDCACDCEINALFDPKNRKECGNKGEKKCGICKCDKNWGGDKCEINCSNSDAKKLEPQCYSNKANGTTVICNNHGRCECGKCICTDGFTGTVCEFDPNSCDLGDNGLICGGANQGACEYGACQCKTDYVGKTCDCLVEEKSLEKCTGPFFNKPCSGNGICVCGKCVCDKTQHENETYSGVYCDLCSDCAMEICKKLEGYVKCYYAHESRSSCSEDHDLIANTISYVIKANVTDLIQMDKWRTGTPCKALLPDGSSILFKYNHDDGKMILMIQKELEPPSKTNMMIHIASAIAGILLLGLLTVVFWKFLVEWHDKREYDKFCKEAIKQGFDISQNPLYESPTLNFVNPTFNQNS